jgi:alpha-beta hydrolase superfamily lysophospholipase
MAQPTTSETPTVVLVHGAFADASSWNGVIERLQKKGVRVTAPANPKITEVEGSHVIMISQPQAVTDVILDAMATVGAGAEQLVGSASEQ